MTAAVGWIVSIAVAVIALFSPLISQVTEISKLRQAWINDLRADVAQFVSLADEWHDMRAQKAVKEMIGEAGPDAPAKRREALTTLYRIRLRLNPLDTNPHRADEDEFLAKLDALMAPGVDRADGWERLANDAVAHGQRLLKREWSVVKRPAYVSLWKAAFGH